MQKSGAGPQPLTQNLELKTENLSRKRVAQKMTRNEEGRRLLRLFVWLFESAARLLE